MAKLADLSFIIDQDLFALKEKEAYKIEKKFSKRLKELNLLIIMDITGSMSSWIEAAKKSILEIVEKIKKQTELMIFQVGFVGYRDFEDTEQFVLQDFTSNVEKIEETLKSTKASGGGDSAQDVLGALKQGRNFTHSNGILQIFLVCDAPSHGESYYEGDYNDEFKQSVKQGELEAEIKKFKDLGYLDTHLECFKITKSTDKMFTKIGKAWGKNFHETDYLKPQDFKFRVVDTIITSIFTTEASLRSSQLQEKKKEDQLKDFEQIDATFETFEFPELAEHSDSDKKKYWSQKFTEELTTMKGETSVKIEKKHFAQGATSYTHRMYDVRRKKMMVCKIPKNEFLDDCQKIDNAQQQFKASAFCFQLSRYFRKIFKDQKNIPPIFYLTPYIYNLEEEFKGVSFVYAEPNIDFEGEKWQKFTNNYETSKSNFLSSFSHFTFAMTAGYLMVTDIQGVINEGSYFLSDPAILCRDEETFSDLTNKGVKGFYAFFSNQHPICSNEICKALKIASARMDIDELKIPELRESGINLEEPMMADKPTILCYFCDGIKQVDLSYYSSYAIHDQMACRKCKELIEREQMKKCSKCKNKFTYSTFFYKKLGLNIPSICPNCKKLKHYKCKDCFHHKKVQYDFCTKCDETYIYKNCDLCNKKVKKFLHENLDNVNCANCLRNFPILSNLPMAESDYEGETESLLFT